MDEQLETERSQRSSACSRFEKGFWSESFESACSFWIEWGIRCRIVFVASSPEITRALASLRRRIRRIQASRGIFRFGLFFLAGLSLLITVDFVFAPLPLLPRLVLFALWLGALAWTLIGALLRPLGRSISDVKLARWLELRHPEIQERISTAIELDGKDAGLSESLLAELSAEAANDISTIDPKEEVSIHRLKKSLIPLAALAASLAALLAIFPEEMSRLMVRAISPFSDSGNAGGVRFSFEPGDLEVLEGEEIELNFSYEGEEEVRLFTRTVSGEEFEESLTPKSTDDEEQSLSYRLPEARSSFDYFLRAGRNESDHFEVKVYPRPTLENATVRYQFPAYTGWPDQVTDLSNGVSALSGTEVTIKSRIPVGVEAAKFLVDQEPGTIPSVSQSANGGDLAWSFPLSGEGIQEGTVMLDHRVREDFELASFKIESLPDDLPVVTLIEPTNTELRLNPEDQVVLVYQITEEIGISAVELELQASQKPQAPLKEVLPKRIKGDDWEGEAMVYLGTLMDRFPKTKEFKLRLRVSDNRPSDFGGPGVGYSEWITVRIQKGAPSLARQELRSDQQEIKKAIQEIIEDTRRAEQKMHQVKHQLGKEELPESAQKKIAEARDRFAEAETKLQELSEMMENSVQQHRTDEVKAIAEKISEAQRNAEFTPLQDNKEARESEAEAAIDNAREAIKALEKLRNEVTKDDRKVEDLAKLQELAQRQDNLAREAQAHQKQAKPQNQPDQNWQRQQERVKNEVQQMVRQSPEAKAAALEAQAEKARELAQEAMAQADTQEQLAEAQKDSLAEEIADALKEEQGKIAEEVKEELAEARSNKEQRADTLPEAVSEAEKARDAHTLEVAAERSHAAVEALEKGQEQSESQQDLRDRQEQVAQAFESLAEGNTEEALDQLQALQAESQKKASAEELAEALKEEQGKIAEEAKEELTEARSNNEERASSLPEAVAKAEEARDALSPESAAESAQAAAEALERGQEQSESQQGLQDRQEQVAEAFEALAEGDLEQARADLAELQNESRADSMTEQIADALKEEQGRIAEEAKGELAEAQLKNEERANSLPEAVAQAEAASEAASLEAAAEFAQTAAEALAEGQENSASQQELQQRQEQVVEAFEALAEGDAGQALAELEELQAANAADFAQELRQFDPTEHNGEFHQARDQAQHASNYAQQARQEQANKRADQAERRHQQSAQNFEQAAAKLEQAAAQFEAQAERAANQQQNQAMASKPGKPLAEALAQSSAAAKSPSTQQAAESAQAAAEALRNAAEEAKSAMAQNRLANQQGPQGKGEQMAQNLPEEEQSDESGEQPGDKPNEQPPQEQGDPGVPPELARLGVSAKDWQKIQATMKSDVSGSSGAVVPEDYRGLVKKYFEQVSGAKK